MADNEVIIDVVAKLDKAEASLKKFEGTAKDSGNAAGLSLSTAIVAGAALAAAAIAALTLGIKKGIDEAILQEDAINDLNAALARSGQFSKEASLGMQEFAVGLQKASIFGDDTILKTATLIQSLGRLSTDGLKTATQASADLAAGLRIDLRSAALLVGKAAVGEISSFSRYGIVIKSGADNAQTFANALKAINQNFGGAAASQINTFGGRLTQANIAFGDLLEEVGNLIIKSPAMVISFKLFSDGINKLSKGIIEFRESGGFERILNTGIDLARFFTSVLGPVFEVIYNRIKLTGEGIGALAFALVSLVTGQFAQAAEAAKEGFGSIFNITETFDLAGTNSALAFIDGFKESVKNAPPIDQEFKNAIQAEADTFSGISWNGFIEGFRMSVEQMSDLAKALMVQLKGTVVAGVGGAFQAIGGALVKGENAFAAFGKAILGMFGDIAIQLGQFYLTLGLANLFLNPAAAFGQLAGGAALLVLGGALKALSGGGGASAPAGGAASGGGGGSTAAITTQQQQPEQQQRGTAVTVNVQGNILDRRQTGLELAEAINEAFSADGVVIARGAFV